MLFIFSTPVLIRYLRLLKTFVFLHWCLIQAVILLGFFKVFYSIFDVFDQISEHDIVESHPDNVLEDLRLDRPFQTLVEFMDTQNLEAMTKQVTPER